jgi:trehalose-6-phosphate synthase
MKKRPGILIAVDDHQSETTRTLTALYELRGAAWITSGDLTLAKADLAAHRAQCASALAPIYHGRVQAPAFQQRWQDAYRTVNYAYASAIAAQADQNAAVWIHDYHLQLIPGLLRKLRPDLRIGLMLHSPFPPVELFAQLPGAGELVTGLLGADLIAFQQERFANNFLDLTAGQPGPRHVHTAVLPVPADTATITRLAAQPEVRAECARIRRALREPETVFLSVAGWEPTEGTLARLDAFARLLTQRRLDPAKVAFIHLVPGGRSPIPEQQDLVERRIGQINGMFSAPSRAVLHYIHRELTTAELVSAYLAADVMVATGLNSGTLQAQEFAAARYDRRGAVILSDLATAPPLPGALSINPHDLDAFANIMLRAAAMAAAPSPEMDSMHALACAEDIKLWASGFLATLTSVSGRRGPAKPSPRATARSGQGVAPARPAG